MSRKRKRWYTKLDANRSGSYWAELLWVTWVPTPEGTMETDVRLYSAHPLRGGRRKATRNFQKLKAYWENRDHFDVTRNPYNPQYVLCISTYVIAFMTKKQRHYGERDGWNCRPSYAGRGQH